MRTITRVVLFSVAIALFAGCTGNDAPKVSPEQLWSGAKAAAQIGGTAYVLSQCKDGKFAGEPCSIAAAQIAATVDTLADDFKPGAVVDPAKREATREAAATEFARTLYRADFVATDDGASARQAQDIAAVRPIVDTIAGILVTLLGK